jgi:hypothetical protein
MVSDRSASVLTPSGLGSIVQTEAAVTVAVRKKTRMRGVDIGVGDGTDSGAAHPPLGR